MSITKPYTFSAGTKARANEVNDDFDVLYSQVNANISRIDSVEFDITELEGNKADVNGNASQRFQVADAINSNDAINKQTLEELTFNTRDYISGLIITKDNNNTIIVSSGSCFSSDYETMMVLASNTSKQNSSQGASTTYYVHLISNDSGTSSDILISQTKISPPLPEGYTKYRNIGSYTTNKSGNINTVFSFGTPINSVTSISGVIETWQDGDSWYRLYSDGFIIQGGMIGSNASISYVKPFKDTTYKILLGTHCTYYEGGGISAKTTTGFSHRNGKSWSYVVDWVAMGYIQE